MLSISDLCILLTFFLIKKYIKMKFCYKDVYFIEILGEDLRAVNALTTHPGTSGC